MSERAGLFANHAPSVPWGIWDVGKVAALFPLSFIIWDNIRPAPLEGVWDSLDWYLLTPVRYVGILWAVWFFSIRKYGTSWRMLGFRNTEAGHLFILVPIAVALNWGFAAAYLLLVDFIGLESLISEQESMAEMLNADVYKPIILLDIGVLAPAIEEIVFRGFILAGLIHTLGGVRGAVVASGLFAIVHLDPDVSPRFFVTGMLLAWLYMCTGSLWPSFPAHAFANAAATAAYELAN